MNKIKKIKARELLDSRGNPALEVEVWSESLIMEWALVPSGASKGKFEAHEIRDQDQKRFFGKGLLKACQNVEKLSSLLEGFRLESIEEIDQKLLEMDGTAHKNILGANVIMGVSLACLRLIARLQKKPLYRLYGDFSALPVPMINVLNGGIHANNNLDIQEFMIVPHGLPSFKEALRASAEVFQTLKELTKEKGQSTALGDEGGVAPSLPDNESALQLIVQSIEKAGYRPGRHISLALDSAASSFFKNKVYHFEGRRLSGGDLISVYDKWINKYPIQSIEDGLDENEWESWAEWTQKHGKKIQIVGDDLFVTQYNRLKKGISRNTANALLVKINQVGTITETLQAIQLARKHHYQCILSHRSGETEDTSIADLSLAFQCGQIKTGGVSRGERTAKYNRLIRIEEELGEKAGYTK